MATFRVTSYTPGFFEGIFTKIAEKFPNFGPMLKGDRWNLFLVIAYLFRITRNFFHRVWNKLKAIRFNKPNAKFYIAHMRLNLMFAIKGLVGLASLGLFNPDITSKASIAVARTRKDVSDIRAGKILSEEEEAGIDIHNDDDKDPSKNSKVTKYQRERIRRNTMDSDSLDDEIEAKLTALNAKEEV